MSGSRAEVCSFLFLLYISTIYIMYNNPSPEVAYSLGTPHVWMEGKHVAYCVDL